MFLLRFPLPHLPRWCRSLARRLRFAWTAVRLVRVSDESIVIRPSRMFPYEVLLTYGEDGTPLLELETTSGGPHDRDGVPYHRVWINDDLTSDHSLPVAQMHYDSVRLPVDRWIAERTNGQVCALTRQLREHLGEHWREQLAHETAERVRIWASQWGPVDAFSTENADSSLSQDLYLALFEHPEHGRCAAVLYDEAGWINDLLVFTSAASAARWRRFDDFDLLCSEEHLWFHRGGLVEGPDAGQLRSAAELWPEGMYVLREGTISSFREGYRVPCPVCATTCEPRYPVS